MIHESLNSARLPSNPQEKVFLTRWQAYVKAGQLPRILREYSVDYTQRACTVAATLIQWLGSPVGIPGI